MFRYTDSSLKIKNKQLVFYAICTSAVISICFIYMAYTYMHIHK